MNSGHPARRPLVQKTEPSRRIERLLFIDNLLVRIDFDIVVIRWTNLILLQERVLLRQPLVRTHFIIVMIRWTGLAPWELEFPFSGSFTSTFLEGGWGESTLGGRPQTAMVRPLLSLQGYLAHKKQPPPLGPP